MSESTPKIVAFERLGRAFLPGSISNRTRHAVLAQTRVDDSPFMGALATPITGSVQGRVPNPTYGTYI